MEEFNCGIFRILNKGKRFVILKDQSVDVNDIMAKWLAAKMVHCDNIVIVYFDSNLQHTISQIAELVDPESIKNEDLFRLELTNGSIILDKMSFNKETIKPNIIVFDCIQDSEELYHLFWELKDDICNVDTQVIFIGYGDYYGVSHQANNHMFADIYWSGRDAYDNRYTKIRIVKEDEDAQLLVN
jgi:hypothetical protein